MEVSPWKKKNCNLSKLTREKKQTGLAGLSVPGCGGVARGRFPPLDDIYRNDKLNIPRTSQKGSSFFKCAVATMIHF